jgi:hypothetical protein
MQVDWLDLIHQLKDNNIDSYVAECEQVGFQPEYASKYLQEFWPKLASKNKHFRQALTPAQEIAALLISEKISTGVSLRLPIVLSKTC